MQVSFVEGMTSTNQWCVPDELHDVSLSIDFDRSMSGIEVDLCNSSHNMSSTVFAVPDVTSRKDDMRNSLTPGDTLRCLQDGNIVSNSHGSEKCQINCYPVSVVHGKKIRYSHLTDIDCTNSVKRFCFNKELEHSENFQMRCRPQSLSTPEHRTSSHFYSSGSVINTILSQVVQLPVMPSSQAIDQGSQGPFHCILLAPTSISTKISEETLTYLNQGQPYEIKIKKTGSSQFEKNVLFRSVVRIRFQERRLQYMENEQIKDWQIQRHGERILEIDMPLSYGVIEATNNLKNINECEFIWDSNYDVGVFFKVNCISTEFTPKKHGGEKGVPFRILLETYAQHHTSDKLHAASCQIKVFKPKGADRKHKTDKDKMNKRLQSEREKFHPQFEYTVFRDICLSDSWPLTHSNMSSYTSSEASTPNSPSSNGCSPINSMLDVRKKECCEAIQATSTTETREESCYKNISSITCQSSASECCLWLQNNMFLNYVKELENYSGKDLLSLTRMDLIDICGAANGIRLFNSLHGRSFGVTTYVRLPTQKAFSAIFIKTSKAFELFSKVKEFCGYPTDYSCEFYVSGPGETRVIVTDEVIRNMFQDSLFIVECIEGSCDEQFYIFFRKVFY